MPTWDDDLVERYLARHADPARHRALARALAPAPDAVVLDVGCGDAGTLRALAPHAPRGRLIGADPSPAMLAVARSTLDAHPAADRVRLVRAPARALPLADGTVDLAIAIDSFEEWDDPAVGLLEIRRVLAPGGRFARVREGGRSVDRDEAEAFAAMIRAIGLALRDTRELSVASTLHTLWICEDARR